MHPPGLPSYPTDSKCLQLNEEENGFNDGSSQEAGPNSSGKEEGEVGYYDEDAPHGVKKFMAMRGMMVSLGDGRKKGGPRLSSTISASRSSNVES